ncbi:coagulation factor X [Hyperolius riggenbachi]|uniref:coagulation factor X n=1 Tax=Hyperolius riggenbachi TaxID=752182 RepID=UPI0035A39E3A
MKSHHSMAGKMYLVILTFLPVVLLEQQETVFLNHDKANSVLGRFKRANSAFEEWKKGNLERECVEEVCSYEEAREVFEDDVKTNEFWNKYFDGDQCEPNPCQYGGSCKDGIGDFTCFCNSGFEGRRCESVILKMCSLNNGGCDQYCKIENRDTVCSCTAGYELGLDGKSCVPTEKYSCGRRTGFRQKRSIPEEVENQAKGINGSQGTDNGTNNATVPTEPAPAKSNDQKETSFIDFTDDDLDFEDNPEERIVGGRECKFGECPWQAVLTNENNEPFCGGTILSRQFILTAAHCMNHTRRFQVVVGEMNTRRSEGFEAIHKVDKTILHPKFVKATFDFDIAVVKLREAINYTDNIIPACLPEPDFADQVLMNEKQAMVSGFGRLHERGAQATKLQMLYVPYVSRQICKESSKGSITENMFCAGYDKEVKDACQGDSGGPHVTPFKDIYFVTGIVSWGEGCAQQGKYGVYTRVSRLHKWLKGVMKKYQ